MITPMFVFTIFMLTLGPIKTVPAFFAMTHAMEPQAARKLALRGTLVATAIALLIALVMRGTAQAWGVSVDALRLAGGILLFAASRDMVMQINQPPALPPPGRHPAVTPLAIPIIITPWGVVAILVFMGLAQGDPALVQTILGLLLLIMALNCAGMLLARQIVGVVGIVSFQVVGWVFAVLQAGLAVEAALISLRNLGLLHTAS